MEKYKLSKGELAAIENSCIPQAVYQFIDNRVVTLALSDGVMDLFGFRDREETIKLLDRDRYSDVHPDDLSRVADSALDFATGKGDYNVVYRSWRPDGYHLIHAVGEHFYPRIDTRLARIWYVDEGLYRSEQEDSVEDAEDPVRKELEVTLSKDIKKDNTLRKLHYDHFTGLPSMIYFFHLASAGRKKLQREGAEAAFCYINLKGMRYYNQKYGFFEGDKLLRAFAGLLKKHFSTENCGRLAQDHFAAYLKAEGLKERLKAFFEEGKDINEGRNLPISVGVYYDRDAGMEISLAIDRAKTACDANTVTERSGYAVYDEKMLARESNRQYVLDNIDRAIEEGWIRPFFHPIVRAANGRVCDEEALARWIDPEKGMLSPAEFIPILEENKLIYKVDLSIVDQVLRRMKEQAKKGLHVVPISVNLSRTDFEVCDIVEEIRGRVDEAGIRRDMLTIEITESVVGSDFDYMKEQVERFQSLGFKVWMDDFGSGYSSLDLLQDLHFDLIKLDMRFMKEFEHGEKSKIILTELVRMALSLGIDTVTEGVETKEQAEFLKEIGCTKLQGYYFCKPIPEEEIYERNEKGIQIGFENPEETSYYASIGAVNLYDLAVVTNGDTESFGDYFDTVPMAVVETKDNVINIIRCNQTFRDFSSRYFIHLTLGEEFIVTEDNEMAGMFLKALRRCVDDGDRTFVDERVGPEESVHGFIRRLAINPVTGVTACAAVILGITSEKAAGMSFVSAARALSSNYHKIYYVNLDTDQFEEYTNDASGGFSAERHGEDFYGESWEVGGDFIYEKDYEGLIEAFTKEHILDSIDRFGAFSYNYRQILDGKPVYMNIRAVRMEKDPHHIVAAVKNVDAEMRQQETMERIMEESAIYARISVLLGKLICMYIVEAETEKFTLYHAVKDFQSLGLDPEGDHFFEKAKEESLKSIWPEDLELFDKGFTRERVLSEIEEKGLYILKYRLMLGGQPHPVCVRAATIEEKGGKRLIFGVTGDDSGR